MPARNDASAVAKAAKAVDRNDVAALLSSLLQGKAEAADPAVTRTAYDAFQMKEVTRSERLSERNARIRRIREEAPPIGSPESAFGEDGELRVSPSPRPMPAPRRRQRSRRAGSDFRKVTKRPFGDTPRYGTARWAKWAVVRDYLGDGAATVSRLVGLPFTHEGKRGAITLHDLEVMESKSLITIEGE